MDESAHLEHGLFMPQSKNKAPCRIASEWSGVHQDFLTTGPRDSGSFIKQIRKGNHVFPDPFNSGSLPAEECRSQISQLFTQGRDESWCLDRITNRK